MPRWSAVVAVVVLAGTAVAAPPPNAKPLSEILATLEQDKNFAYFKEVEWDEDGLWETASRWRSR